MVHLDYRDARPIYLQIVEGFREQITAGVLHPGDKLPSVRELAADLAINPNTIQRAYRQLEIEGFTVSVAGKGSFVCRIPDLRQQEKERLFKILDDTRAALLQLGVTPQELAAHMEKGGEDHA